MTTPPAAVLEDTAKKTVKEPETAPAATSAPAKKTRVATVWLDGCSGCHMSLLDMDERIVDIAGQIDLVYGPLVDFKEFPADVDVAIVEGAISSDEDVERIEEIRAKSKVLVAMGDCGITSNVPGMRNPIGTDRMLHAVYGDGVPSQGIPKLLPNSRPIQEFVTVDVYIPGCPPSADTIHFAITELLAGRTPDLHARFG